MAGLFATHSVICSSTRPLFQEATPDCHPGAHSPDQHLASWPGQRVRSPWPAPPLPGWRCVARSQPHKKLHQRHAQTREHGHTDTPLGPSLFKWSVSSCGEPAKGTVSFWSADLSRVGDGGRRGRQTLRHNPELGDGEEGQNGDRPRPGATGTCWLLGTHRKTG